MGLQEQGVVKKSMDNWRVCKGGGVRCLQFPIFYRYRKRNVTVFLEVRNEVLFCTNGKKGSGSSKVRVAVGWRIKNYWC